MGRAGRMNTVAVFVSRLLLAVPIMEEANTLCDRVDDLRSYAELLDE